MNEQIQAKGFGCATVWFGLAVLWIFLFAHIFDDVRHGTENLFLFVVVPFMIAAAVFSVAIGRWFWERLPNFAPCQSKSQPSLFPVAVSVLISILIAEIWIHSPLFRLIYDSCKIISLIILSGLILGFVYKVGGRLSVMQSVLSGVLAAVTSYLSFLIMIFLFNGGRDLWSGVGMFASIGVPYVVAVVLYDCYRKASSAIE